MTTAGTIDYDALAQRALLKVLRDVLRQTEQYGLPGEHHFYISFDTQAPGVILSDRLKAKYPKEMTIVLQHRFWDLAVRDDDFEVKLTFDGIPERLVVPFDAIRVFFDPSVRYAIQFNSAEADLGPNELPSASDGDEQPATPDSPAASEAVPPNAPLPLPVRPVPKVPAAPIRAVKPPESLTKDTGKSKLSDRDGSGAEEKSRAASDADRREGDKPVEKDEDRTPAPGVVVSLDSFRKK